MSHFTYALLMSISGAVLGTAILLLILFISALFFTESKDMAIRRHQLTSRHLVKWLDMSYIKSQKAEHGPFPTALYCRECGAPCCCDCDIHRDTLPHYST